VEVQETAANTQATSNRLDFPVRYRIVVGSLSSDTSSQNGSGRNPLHHASPDGKFPIKTQCHGDAETFLDRLAVRGVGMCRMEGHGWSNAVIGIWYSTAERWKERS
jgi:hypothetical protein